MGCEFCDIVNVELKEIIPHPTDYQRKYWKKNYEGGEIDGSMYEKYFDLIKEMVINEMWLDELKENIKKEKKGSK